MDSKFEKLKTNLIKVIGSKYFFWGVIGLFLLQTLFLTVAIDQPESSTGTTENHLFRTVGIVPDGNRHMAAIYHFAKQPIEKGPWIHDMTADELMMGDLVRFPSYFYYYLLSFPVRVALAFNLSDLAIITMARLFGVLFGVLILLVFSRIVRRVTNNRAIQNLAVLMLAMTGSFVYLTPAENYDILSLLFWMLYILASIRLAMDKDFSQLYWMVVWFSLLSVTKYTYIPFMVVAAIPVIGYLLHTKSLTNKTVSNETKKLKKYISSNKIKAFLLAVLMVVSVGLFAERIGGNLIGYQSFSPKCDRVHSAEDCMRFGVYNRNINRLESVEKGETWTKEFNFFEYTSMWIMRYYATNFYYMGHYWVHNPRPAMLNAGVVVLIIAAAIAVGLSIKRRLPFTRKVEWYLLLVVAVLIAGQYAHNVMIFFTYSGETYGHQGRYLLPAIGFIYLLFLMAAYRLYGVLSKKARLWMFWVGVILAVYFIYTNSAVANFIYHAQEPVWYSELFRNLLFK